MHAFSMAINNSMISRLCWVLLDYRGLGFNNTTRFELLLNKKLRSPLLNIA